MLILLEADEVNPVATKDITPLVATHQVTNLPVSLPQRAFIDAEVIGLYPSGIVSERLDSIVGKVLFIIGEPCMITKLPILAMVIGIPYPKEITFLV